jgi:hypothetical protein
MHGKPAEMLAAALDALLTIELEAEECPRRETGVSGNSRGTDSP